MARRTETLFPDPLVVMALEQESAGAFARADIPVLYTGVGKINATYHLTRRLAAYEQAGRSLPHVINFGTAGSDTIPRGRFVACTTFVQRDMDATALGFDPCVTPFDRAPPKLEFPALVEGLENAVCGTGDSFAIAGCGVHCDVVEMEAYALAKVCWLHGATFSCVKWITDGSDPEAARAWQENVGSAAERFVEMYLELERTVRVLHSKDNASD